MKKDPALPPRVFPHGRWYRIAIANGDKREWHNLSKIKAGLPALWMAYQAFLDSDVKGDLMPALIAQWRTDMMCAYKPKVQEDYRRMTEHVADGLAEFRVADLEPTDVTEFLGSWANKHRMFNRYRSLVRELMRFAIEKGLRKTGTNPVDGIIRTKPERPRTRYITDSELRRIKIGHLYGSDERPTKTGKPRRTRSGIMMVCLIELAYLTGQDVGMLIRIRKKRDPTDPDEPHVCEEGIFFRRSKVENTTGAAVVVQWTPRLRAVVNRLLALHAERQRCKRKHQCVECDMLLFKQGGSPMTYEAVASAWQRGVKRACVPPTMFRDLRAKALTDKERREGIAAANAMGAHSTESQTADYVRRKKARHTAAVR